ncbi:MAG: P-type conjugative transfer protein TrbJ [Sphingomonas sp.]
MIKKIRAYPTQKCLVAAALALASCGSLGMALYVSPARAQLTVFDPGNYSQNILTAARTLEQINNQIRSLQNEATMIENQARNLSRIDFPEMQALKQKLQQIDQLMAQARGVSFRSDSIDAEFRQLFPQALGRALSTDTRVIDAKARLDTSLAAFSQTMKVQGQVVGNITADSDALTAIAAKSQGAEGGLQAQQAANQLLALAVKQQMQIQQLMAAQYRADALEAARRAQAEAEGKAATTKFLGTGQAYTPR